MTKLREVLRVAHDRIARGEAKPLQIDQERLLPVERSLNLTQLEVVQRLIETGKPILTHPERALPQRGMVSAPSVTDEETK